MEKMNEYPDTEEEMLQTHICGCGTVEDLIRQAAKIVQHMIIGADHGCIIWNMHLVDMVHQLYVNRVVYENVMESGASAGTAKAHALHEILSNDMQKIVEVSQNHIKKTIIEMAQEHDPSEADGHTHH